MLNPGPAGSQSARRFGSTQKTEVWVGPEWTEITGKPGPPAGPSREPVQPIFFFSATLPDEAHDEDDEQDDEADGEA